MRLPDARVRLPDQTRGEAVKRTALKRKSGLHRRRPKPIGVIVADLWRDGLHEERCVVCGTRVHLDGHHAIPRRVLIRLGLADHIMDKRNRVPVCRHDHESHECAHRRIRRCELPASVFEFAAELGLDWYLDRFYPTAEVAA